MDNRDCIKVIAGMFERDSKMKIYKLFMIRDFVIGYFVFRRNYAICKY